MWYEDLLPRSEGEDSISIAFIDGLELRETAQSNTDLLGLLTASPNAIICDINQLRTCSVLDTRLDTLGMGDIQKDA